MQAFFHIKNKNKRKEFFELIGHISVGLSIFAKGIDKIEHHHVLIGMFLLLAGALIFMFVFNHKKIESILGQFKYFVLGIEGIVMALIGYSYYQDGTHLLHYAYFIVSFMFFIAIPISYYLHESPKRKEFLK